MDGREPREDGEGARRRRNSLLVLSDHWPPEPEHGEGDREAQGEGAEPCPEQEQEHRGERGRRRRRGSLFVLCLLFVAALVLLLCRLDAPPEQVAEKSGSIVKRHLLVVERARKQPRAQDPPARRRSRGGRGAPAEADPVELEVAVVDEDARGLEEHRRRGPEERDPLPLLFLLPLLLLRGEHNERRQRAGEPHGRVGGQHGSPHRPLGPGALEAPRLVRQGEREFFLLLGQQELCQELAVEPGLVARERRVVEAPPGEVVARGVDVPGRERGRERDMRGRGLRKEGRKARRSIDRSVESIGIPKLLQNSPFRRLQVDGELHPVPLRLVVAVLGRVSRARVRAQADNDPQGQGEGDEESEHFFLSSELRKCNSLSLDLQ